MISWHTKHRPKQVKDLHLSSVREQLQLMMDAGRLPQVFLFAGPKGTGKTSASRIIGALVNEPANQELVEHLYFGASKSKSKKFQDPDPKSPLSEQIFKGNSFVVQEMDAASNRGIDDIRSLKERVTLPPQEGKMSVFILDEAHMLTTEAFNALLKLLEEPPAHTIFILATTELHKIPDTVKSRCTLVSFKKASREELVLALKNVLDVEKIDYEDDALELIATQADGSFRDGVKLAEQIATNYSRVKIKDVEKILLTQNNKYKELIDAVLSKDEVVLAKVMEDVRSDGVNPTQFFISLVRFLHQDLLKALKVEAGSPLYDSKVTHFLLNELVMVTTSNDSVIPLLELELKLLELVFRAKNKTNSESKPSSKKKIIEQDDLVKQADLDEVSTIRSSLEKVTKDKIDLELDSVISEQVANSDNLVKPSSIDTRALLEGWESFVKIVEQRNSTVAALLRSANPVPGDEIGKARVEVFYSFHREQLQQPKFLRMLQECAETVLGEKPHFEFVVASRPVVTSVAETGSNLEIMADEILR